MMPQLSDKQQPIRHTRATRPAPVSPAASPAVPAKHKPGSPPTLCIVATADELAYIEELGIGKARAVHAALRLMREVKDGKLSLRNKIPDYLNFSEPKPKPTDTPPAA